MLPEIDKEQTCKPQRYEVWSTVPPSGKFWMKFQPKYADDPFECEKAVRSGSLGRNTSKDVGSSKFSFSVAVFHPGGTYGGKMIEFLWKVEPRHPPSPRSLQWRKTRSGIKLPADSQQNTPWEYFKYRILLGNTSNKPGTELSRFSGLIRPQAVDVYKLLKWDLKANLFMHLAKSNGAYKSSRNPHKTGRGGISVILDSEAASNWRFPPKVKTSWRHLWCRWKEGRKGLKFVQPTLPQRSNNNNGGRRGKELNTSSRNTKCIGVNLAKSVCLNCVHTKFLHKDNFDIWLWRMFELLITLQSCWAGVDGVADVGGG